MPPAPHFSSAPTQAMFHTCATTFVLDYGSKVFSIFGTEVSGHLQPGPTKPSQNSKCPVTWSRPPSSHMQWPIRPHDSLKDVGYKPDAACKRDENIPKQTQNIYLTLIC